MVAGAEIIVSEVFHGIPQGRCSQVEDPSTGYI